MSPRVKAILVETAKDHGVTVEGLLSQDRRRVLAFARFDAWRRIRALLNSEGKPLCSLPTIGRIFNRDHTTILHGLRRSEVVFQPYQAPGANPPTSAIYLWAAGDNSEKPSANHGNISP